MPLTEIRRRELLLTLPSLGWLLVFFALPALLVVLTAFRPAEVRGGVGAGWSLETLRSVLAAEYGAILWRTLWMSAVTTVLCLLLALPVAWCMARAGMLWRKILLLLVVVPFLTNFIIRIFAWKSLLHPEGALTRLLAWSGVISGDALLSNNAGAVLVVMIYTLLPFAILPLYAAAEKFDFTLLEAARDLGASRAAALWRVFVPDIRRGLSSAGLMVFVGALGQYVVPQFVGGTGDEMLGSKIAQRAFADRDVPHACALAAALMLAVFGLMLVGALWRRFSNKEAGA